MTSNKLNLLPSHGESAAEDAAAPRGRFPSWLHRPLPKGGTFFNTHDILRKYRLNTVCEEAKCPNRMECYTRGTATFLALGKECSRNCGFCDIDFSKTPKAPEADEPERIAHSVRELGLRHTVITMVARDDLPDGGAAHIARIVEAIRLHAPGVAVELLTSDFQGNTASLDLVLATRPEVFNHNLETVRRLTPRVRHKATYDRTLQVLAYAKQHLPQGHIKSGLMLGLGETEEEVHESLRDLQGIGCTIVTMGHYLQPNHNKLTVKQFITPEQFDAYADYGRSIGIPTVFSGPFVRSSYHAGELMSTLST